MSGPLLTFLYSSSKLRQGHQRALQMLKTAAETRRDTETRPA
jgi:hypothetical protein